MLILVDTYTGQINVFLFALLEVIGFVWIYGLNNLLRDIKFMLGIDLGIYWKFCWSFFIPLASSFLFVLHMSSFEQITYGGKDYPLGAILLGYFLITLALLQFPLWAIYEILKSPEVTLIKKIKAVFKPNNEWGPRNSTIREEWLNECDQKTLGFWKNISDWFTSKSKDQNLTL